MLPEPETGTWPASGTASPPAALPPVAWLVDSLRLGGAERLALAFAQEYVRRGGRAKLIALKAAPAGETALESEAHRLGLNWICLRAHHLRDLAAWRRLQRVLGESQPAVLHAHLRYATLWGALAAWRRRLPLVVTLHVLPEASREHGRRSALARLERWVLKHQARQVLVLGSDQAAAWRRAGLDCHSVRLLPNGISLPTPAPDARNRLRAALGIPITDPVFLTVAAVRAEKGWRDWLEIIGQIRRRFPHAQFIWLGAGPDLEALRKCAPPRAGTHLPGLQINVADWLAAADVFLFPSHREAMPTALAEALAAHLPAAAYRLPANLEVVRGCAALHSAPIGDTAALAAAACDALAAPPRSSDHTGALGQTWDAGVWIDRLASIYRQLADATPPVRRDARRKAGQGSGLAMVEFFSRGGLFHYSLQLAEGFARQGAAVTLLTGRQPEMAPATLPGLRFAPVLPTWNPRRPVHSRWRARLQRVIHAGQYAHAWWRILRWVRRHQPQWVLLGDLEHRCDGWAVAWLRHHGFRVADICHNPAMFDRRPSPASQPRSLTRQPTWRRRMLARLDLIFVHAQVLAEQITASTGRGAIVIPHGGQSLFLTAAAAGRHWRQQWGWPPERPIALLFGTLTRYKGIPTLLTAMASLPAAARPGLVLAGFPAADADPHAWRREARRMGLDPWLRWELAYVPSSEVAGLFRAVDFVVLPYWEASQSGVAHLALTFSRPVIATTCGGLPAVIRHGENGLLVPPRDAAALASALSQMTGSEAWRQHPGENAAAYPEHDWEVIAGKILRQIWPQPTPPAAQAATALHPESPQTPAGAGQPEQDHLRGEHNADDARKPGASDRQDHHRPPGRQRVLEQVQIGDNHPGDATTP